jgi:hypothetical protein
MGNAPLSHGMCGHVLNLDLSAQAVLASGRRRRPDMFGLGKFFGIQLGTSTKEG